MTMPLPRLALLVAAALSCAPAMAAETHATLDPLIAQYARRHGVPEHLLHRLIARESGYNAAAFNRRFYGLMQITYVTARGMGYHGTPHGLLDPEVNLTYGVPYLANAYRLAHGSETRAMRLYASGFYYLAKRRHMLNDMRTAASPSLDVAQATKTAAAH